MARPATGTIDERRTTAGRSWRLRFRAYGQRQTVTVHERDGWTRSKAEDELANLLADVRRGTYTLPQAADPEPSAPPTFYEIARDWYEAELPHLKPRTRVDYEWRLNAHLLPYFGDTPVAAIDVATVDGYRQDRVRESQRRRAALEAWEKEVAKLPRKQWPARPPRALSNDTINKTLVTLGAILELAVERDLMARNPMRVRTAKRKLRTSKPRRRWLDSADQIAALVAAAAQLDAAATNDRRAYRRALISTLTFGGLRIGELCDLRWRDVDLASGWIKLADSKTDAGVRDVRMLPVLRDELVTWKATTTHTAPAAFVFPTRTGKRHSEDNVRDRIVAKAVTAASLAMVDADRPPLPDGLTPHSLRHTFTSLLFALGVDLPEVMAQVGHSTERMTLSVYAHTMRLDQAQREALRDLADGVTVDTGQGSAAPALRAVA